MLVRRMTGRPCCQPTDGRCTFGLLRDASACLRSWKWCMRAQGCPAEADKQASEMCGAGGLAEHYLAVRPPGRLAHVDAQIDQIERQVGMRTGWKSVP
jgi:hypothetical protein